MSSITPDSVRGELDVKAMRIGNFITTSTGATSTTSSALYADSTGQLNSGSLPFTVPLYAGITNTGYSVVKIRGQATGSADELMHLTLVKGANATATIAGYFRITVADDAGVVTNGDYYAPFYTLG